MTKIDIAELPQVYSLDKSIKSRARWVSNRYPELRYSDLIQEAYKLIIQIGRKGGITDVPYLLQAVYNHYSNLIRKTYARQNIWHDPMEYAEHVADSSVTAEFQEIENNFDRQKFLATIEDKKLLQTINSLLDGLSIQEVAAKYNISTRHVYRQLTKIKLLRESWERKNGLY